MRKSTKSVTKKITPAVQLMLERAASMEREAALLRQLANANATIAYYKGRNASRTRRKPGVPGYVVGVQ